MRIRSVTVCGTACALAVVVAGCSGAGATSCSDYAGGSFDEKGETIRALLQEHRLEPDDANNVLGASSAVDRYCGTFGPIPGAATRNADNPIDQAIDWDSPTW